MSACCKNWAEKLAHRVCTLQNVQLFEGGTPLACKVHLLQMCGPFYQMLVNSVSDAGHARAWEQHPGGFPGCPSSRAHVYLYGLLSVGRCKRACRKRNSRSCACRSE